MANGSTRTLAVIISLIVGFAVGWLLHRGPKKVQHPRPTVAQDASILIGPDDPCTLKFASGGDATTIELKRGRDKAQWDSANNKDGNKFPIYIIAHVPKCSTNPFPKGTKIGTDADGNDVYLIGDGTKTHEETGVIDASACPTTDVDDQTTYIKYDQFIQIKGLGVFRSCDGMIIIDK